MGLTLRLGFMLLVMRVMTCPMAMASNSTSLEQLTTAQGLNQSEITNLLQDSSGALWIGNTQGLNRYDGYRISSIESPGDILSTYNVELLIEDSKGNIWISAAPNKNFVLDPIANELTEVVLPSLKDRKITDTAFTTMIENDDGDLWFSTYQEIFFFERKANRFRYVTGLDKIMLEYDKLMDSIRALLLIDDYLLIATSNQLYAYNVRTNQSHLIKLVADAQRNINNQNTKALLRKGDGKIFVGTVEGLFEINEADIAKAAASSELIANQVIPDLNIWKILEKDDFYWLATDKGLYQLSDSNQSTLRLRFSETKFNTGDDDIVAMIEDREGVLWLGSRGDGIFKWSPTPAIKKHFWSRAEQGQNLSHDQVYSVLQTPDGAIWLGTLNGLNRIDPETGLVSHYLVNPDEKAVSSESSIGEMIHHNGFLWLNTEGGLRVLDVASKQLVELDLPEELKIFTVNEYYTMKKFHKNQITFFSTDSIYRYDIVKNEFHSDAYPTNNQTTLESPYIIFDVKSVDADWVFVSLNNALGEFNINTGEVRRFHEIKPTSNELISPHGVIRDRSSIWVSYSGLGVFKLDGKTGQELAFYSEKELGAFTVMDIFRDKNQNLWFVSNSGLVRMNPETGDRRLFDESDGFLASEFNGNSLLMLDNGSLIIGSIKGAYLLAPEEFNTQSVNNLKTHITQLSLLSKSIPSSLTYYDDSQLQLEHNDFGLRVEFSPLLLNKPHQLRYRYRIEGDSPVQTTTIKKNELFVPAFKSGTSRIYISAIDYETGKEAMPAVLTITTLPPPWLSKQAYAVYIIGTLTILSVLWFWTRKRQHHKAMAHQAVIHSEERLKLALKGGNSGLWDWHAVDNKVYDPRLSDDNAKLAGSVFPFESRLEAMHPDDKIVFENSWLKFLDNPMKSFNHVYRMALKSGEWAWFRDMATVTLKDDSGAPLRITGTYTNITKRKRDRDQMRLYSKAFENTRDIVFVLDEDNRVIAANQALLKMANLRESDVIEKAVDFLVDNEGNHGLMEQIMALLAKGKHWEGEGFLLREKMSPLPILINATQFESTDNQQNFVFALTDISSQKTAEAELRKLANYDNLTGLPNRALLIERIVHAIYQCRRRHQGIALFFIDLDRFKRINDTLGHDIGDLLLIKVAHILKNAVRQDDTVARLGGDEFVVMLEDVEGIDAINHIAQDIIEKMKKPVLLRENQVSVSPSIGISLYPTDGEDAETLLKHADIAMYHAKKEGRNNFQYYETSMNLAAKKRLLLENKLRLGIERNEFYLHYQPQFDLGSGQLVSVEALARWRDDTGNFIPPSEFIPLAEELGLIITLSEKLLELAIESLSRWHSKGVMIGLAFNLSARHLQHYDLSRFVDKLLERFPIKTQLLEFELTESVLMEDVERVQRLFEGLADKGVELALDDFGTGFSSLRYLSQLPIKKLKIDRSFVAQIGENPEMEAIIQAILTLADSLKMKTVAEGIETREQAEFLKYSGAGCAQGFLFSKPLEIAALETLLMEKSKLSVKAKESI